MQATNAAKGAYKAHREAAEREKDAVIGLWGTWTCSMFLQLGVRPLRKQKCLVEGCRAVKEGKCMRIARLAVHGTYPSWNEGHL